jgi:septal ring factor EnvC (AmiA/AmiB activator)
MLKRPIPDSYINSEFAKIAQKNEEMKTDQDRFRQEEKSKKDLNRTLRKVDKELKRMEFGV